MNLPLDYNNISESFEQNGYGIDDDSSENLLRKRSREEKELDDKVIV
jgi:hypothetical protein